MQNFPSIILGIAPGAKQIGVAVLKKQELVCYAVKTFIKQNRTDSLENLRKIIEELTTEYKIEAVAVEKLILVQQQRTFVKIVSDEIRKIFKDQNIPLFEYHPAFTRQVICNLQKPTRRNTSLILSQKYSELVRYFDVRRLWQVRYFALLFGAVAVALVCSIELRETAQLSSKPKGNSNV